jgi:predicted membrane protein
MALETICAPALIYIVFSLTQIIVDTSKGLYNVALMKFWVAIIFTVLLNYLCQRGLGIVSWIIVFIPFILMTVIIGILLNVLGLDPRTGKLRVKDLGNNKEEILYDVRQKYSSIYNNVNNDIHKGTQYIKQKYDDIYNEIMNDGSSNNSSSNNSSSNDKNSTQNKNNNNQKLLGKHFDNYNDPNVNTMISN